MFLFGYVIVFANPIVSSDQKIQVDSAFVAQDDSSSPDIKIDESRELLDEENMGVLQYIVQPGDNLIKIASKFGTTVSKIQKVNNIKDSINPGQMLVISDDNDGFLYTIPEDVNVVVFANKYNLNLEDFMSLNYIQDQSEMLYKEQDVFINLTQEQAYDNWLLQRPVIIPQEQYKPVIVKASPKAPGTKTAASTIKKWANGVVSAITNNTPNPVKTSGIIAQWVYKKDIKNSFYPGYCTWYAAIKSPNIFPYSSDNKQERIFWGNAREWCANAKKAGFKTGKKPAAWALIVYARWGRLASAGHVGKVIKYDSDEGRMVIEDMNRVAKFVVTQRREDTDNGNISCYIYGK